MVELSYWQILLLFFLVCMIYGFEVWWFYRKEKTRIMLEYEAQLRILQQAKNEKQGFEHELALADQVANFNQYFLNVRKQIQSLEEMVHTSQLRLSRLEDAQSAQWLSPAPPEEIPVVIKNKNSTRKAAPTPSEDELDYARAIEMAKNGFGRDLIIEQCGLSEAEVDFILSIHQNPLANQSL